MRSDDTHRIKPSLSIRILSGAILWLMLISGLHYWLNYADSMLEREIVRMGYMPVITNLAAPLLDRVSEKEEQCRVRFKAVKFASFAEMAEALRNNDIQAAFIIAPLAVVLRRQGEDIKIVYIGNRHESTLVARKDLNVKTLDDLAGKTIAVPMRYSGHNLSLLRLLEERKLSGKVRIVEMNPPDMASALVSGSLDAYYVGEPFAAQTLKSGHGTLVTYAENLWPGFICNLLIVRQKFIQENPEIVKRLVSGAVRSGLWAEKHTESAAGIASAYWGTPVELITYALTIPPHRVCFDRFIPKQEEIQEMADLMLRFGMTASADIDGLIDDRFARQTDLTRISTLSDILGP